MAAVFQRPAARRDLVEHFVYLAENAGEAVADRFLANVEASLIALSEHPEMGAPLTLRRPELAGLRKWPVKDFEKFLIVYIPRPQSESQSCACSTRHRTGGACCELTHRNIEKGPNPFPSALGEGYPPVVRVD